MKIIIVFIFLVVSFFNATGQTPATKTDLEFGHLRGRVKSITSISYRVKVDTSSRSIQKIPVTKGIEPFEKDYTLYNNIGNRLVRYHYGEKNELRGRDTFIFNADGKLLTDSTYFYRLHTYLLRVNKYNDKGLLVASGSYDSFDSTSYKYIPKYDDKGTKISEDVFKNAKFNHRSVYTYDDKGRITEIKNFSASGAVLSDNKFVNEFDANGNVISAKTYDKIGKLTSTETDTYNEHGDRIKHTADDKKSHSRGASEDMNYTQQFLEYDEQGNWLKCIHRVEGYSYDFIEERTIVYY